MIILKNEIDTKKRDIFWCLIERKDLDLINSMITKTRKEIPHSILTNTLMNRLRSMQKTINYWLRKKI